VLDLPVQILGHGFAAGMDVQLPVDAFDVHPDGVNAQRKDVRDFLVGDALGQVIQHFPFALGEPLDLRFGAAPLIEIPHHSPGNVPAHRRMAPVHLGDGVQVFAFRTVPHTGVTIYSATAAQASDVTSNDVFAVHWTWNAVSGAQGYRLLRNLNGGGYGEFVDVVGNSYSDANTGWAGGNTVTPTT